MSAAASSTAYVTFCGERFDLSPEEPFVIGRHGNLRLDDNPYLHRRFLEIGFVEPMWWIANVGSQLTATIADESGLMQTWLSPGARVPLVFPCTTVWFSAGSTNFELEVAVEAAPYFRSADIEPQVGEQTIGRSAFTPDQFILVVALCEDSLRNGNLVATVLPTAAQAAERLRWTVTKFNRKLDNVCQKLERAGIAGLHGGPDGLALNRRARLVQYALATRLVTRDDLTLLDGIEASA